MCDFISNRSVVCLWERNFSRVCKVIDRATCPAHKRLLLLILSDALVSDMMKIVCDDDRSSPGIITLLRGNGSICLINSI